MKYTRRQIKDAILALEICGQEFTSLHSSQLGIKEEAKKLAYFAMLAVDKTGIVFITEPRCYPNFLEAAAILRDGWLPGRIVKRINP
jgi:hypothetical protein